MLSSCTRSAISIPSRSARWRDAQDCFLFAARRYG
jgi:hypothetical protein